LRQVAGQRIAAVAADTRLRPAAVPVLRRLRRLGVSIGLVSDCGPELPEFLPELPIAPLLDAVVLSIDLQRHKPDPRMYWDACRRLRVDPAECLYVGDGGSQELTGAAAAGMTAVRLAAPDLGGHLVFGADTGWAGASVESLEEIVPMVAAARPSAAATPRRPVPPRLRLA
jgi:putative hydrolase of the HAD superfamily